MDARLDVISQAIGCSEDGNLTFDFESDYSIDKYTDYNFIN